LRSNRKHTAEELESYILLYLDYGIPKSLGEIGVDKDYIDTLVDIAYNDELYMEPNPRNASKEDIEEILDNAIKG